MELQFNCPHCEKETTAIDGQLKDDRPSVKCAECKETVYVEFMTEEDRRRLFRNWVPKLLGDNCSACGAFFVHKCEPLPPATDWPKLKEELRKREERTVFERSKDVLIGDVCDCNDDRGVTCWRHRYIAKEIEEAMEDTARAAKKHFAEKIRGAVPMPFHVKNGNEAGMTFVAEILFRLADEIEGKERNDRKRKAPRGE